MITRKHNILVLLLLMFSATVALSEIKVVTTTTDLAWAVREIGGELVEVESMLGGTEDPHFVDALPSYVLMAARADIVCSVGLDLEIGWLPRVLKRSNNTDVQTGGKGFCEFGNGIEAKNIPHNHIDRSMGHVHSKGNPHFWLQPTVLAKAAKQVLPALIKKAPEKEEYFNHRYQAFVAKMQTLENDMLKIVQPFKDKLRVLEYHEEFLYYLSALSLKPYGALEEKPGLPPSAGRIAQVAIQAKEQRITTLLATNSAPKDVLTRFSSLAPATNVIVTEISLNPDKGITDYKEMILNLTRKLVSPFGEVSKALKPNHELH